MPDEISKQVSALTSELAKSVYQDVVSPAAKRVGSALESIFKVGLSPVAMLDWGFERTKQWLSEKVERKLSSTPVEFLVLPQIAIAVGAVNGVALAADTPGIRDMYAELLLKALDKRTSDAVHPSFISVIGQLSAPEAMVFMSFLSKAEDTLFMEKRGPYSRSPGLTIEAQFAEHCLSLGVNDPGLARVWLVNLQRLGLVQIDRDSEVTYVREDYDEPHPRVESTDYRQLHVTEFGQAFLEACAPRDEL